MVLPGALPNSLLLFTALVALLLPGLLLLPMLVLLLLITLILTPVLILLLLVRLLLLPVLVLLLLISLLFGRSLLHRPLLLPGLILLFPLLIVLCTSGNNDSQKQCQIGRSDYYSCLHLNYLAFRSLVATCPGASFLL